MKVLISDYIREPRPRDWSRGPMEVANYIKQRLLRSPGGVSLDGELSRLRRVLLPSTAWNKSIRALSPNLDKLDVLLSVLVRDLRRHRASGSYPLQLTAVGTTNISILDEHCERAKREARNEIYFSNATAIDYVQRTKDTNKKLGVSKTDGHLEDNETVTVLPLDESEQENGTTEKAREHTRQRKVSSRRRSRGRAYRSRVITPTQAPGCQTILACIHPYISYLAGTIMFILVVYLIIVFGKCVCDDSF